MWIILACGSAVFAGITSILAKCGIKRTDSDLATALRTIIVFLFSLLMVSIAGSFKTISQISWHSLLFLIISGIATGASWICYYSAIQSGIVSIVVPVDKLSILVSVLFSVLILKEKISKKSVLGLILIIFGTLAMVFFS